MGPCNSTNAKNRNRTTARNTKVNLERKKTNGEYFFSNDLTNKDKITKKYKLSSELLGKGGCGIVYEGVDKQGKRYAIKRINKLVIKNVTNITEEVKISLACSHENIVKLFEVYEDIKTISFVMEISEGGDLFDFITESPIHHLTDCEALDIITQILNALDYLHNTQNVVHRDIKPENFLVTIEDNKPIVKLIDFGFACHIPDKGDMNDDFGSPIYTAPEILLKENYTEKVDLWSSGIILFNMLTGFQPFSSETESGIDDEVLNKEINFDVIPNAQMRELCMGLLQKNPKERFSTKKALEIARKIILSEAPTIEDIKTKDKPHIYSYNNYSPSIAVHS